MNRILRSPSHVLPQTIRLVLLVTVRKRFGDGVNKLGSTGSSVIVGRNVAVNVGRGVTVAICVPASAVVDASAVLMTNRFAVFVGCNENGVAVGFGEETGVGVPRNGREIGGSPLQLARTETSIRINKNLFIKPLQ